MEVVLQMVKTLHDKLEKNLGKDGEIFKLKTELEEMRVREQHIIKKNEELQNNIEEVMEKKNKDLKTELVKIEKRVREGVMDEMKGWRIENYIANVDFKEVIEK